MLRSSDRTSGEIPVQQGTKDLTTLVADGSDKVAQIRPLFANGKEQRTNWSRFTEQGALVKYGLWSFVAFPGDIFNWRS